MKKRILAVLLVFSLLSALAACSSEAKTDTQTPATAPQADNAQTAEAPKADAKKDFGTIRVGTNPGTGNIFGFIAMDKGFDKEEGYTTELVNFDNSSDALNALQSSKIDVGVNFGTAAPLTFISQGADLTMFGGYVSGGMPVYAAPDFQYEGLESFVGKKIGTARMYTPDILFRGAMMNAGYDLAADVQINEFKKPSEVLAAVKAGQVDVGVGTNSTYLGAMDSGLKVLCWTNDLDPEAVCCRQVTRTDWINNNTDAAVAYIKSLLRAEEVLYTDPEYAVQVFAKNMELEEDRAKLLLMETNQELWTDPKSNGIQSMWETMKALNYVENKDMDVTKHINIDVYKTALDQLLEEYPDNAYFKTLVARYETNNSVLLGK